MRITRRKAPSPTAGRCPQNQRNVKSSRWIDAQTLDGFVRKYILVTTGGSDSGKSLNGELLRGAHGRDAGYAQTLGTDSIFTAPPPQDKPNPEVIGLEGKRLASNFDTKLSTAKQLSVPKLQTWTGGDAIAVRERGAAANRNPPIKPTWQIHVASNSTLPVAAIAPSLRDRIVVDLRTVRFANEANEIMSIFSRRSVFTKNGETSLKQAIEEGLPYQTSDDPSEQWHDLPSAYRALLITKYDPRMTSLDVKHCNIEPLIG